MASSPRLPQFPAPARPVVELLRANTELAFIVADDGAVSWASASSDVLLGRSPESLLGQQIGSLVASFDRSVIRDWQRGGLVGTPREVRFEHTSGRLVPITVSADHPQPGRSVLTGHDLTSWHVVQLALEGRLEAEQNPVDAAPLPLLLLDAQLHARAASRSWNELTGLAGEDPGLDWLYAIDPDSLELLQQALPALCSGGAWRSTVWICSAALSVRRVDLAVAASVGSRGQLLGFVVVGAPVGEVVSVVGPSADAQRPGVGESSGSSPAKVAPGAASAEGASAGEVNRAIAADPDRPIRMAIAAVLARANAKLRKSDQAPPSSPPLGEVIPEASAEPGDGIDPLDDELGLSVAYHPGGVPDETAMDPGRMPVDEPARSDLFDHLGHVRTDGMASVMSVALLFIDVLSTGAAEDSPGDRRYNLRMLERRLRTTVRENEYAALLGDQGFVVATRGTFTRPDIDSLTVRLMAKLSTPLRGHQVSGAPQICAGAAVSFPGESDTDLVSRAELARAKAVAAGASAVVIDASL